MKRFSFRLDRVMQLRLAAERAQAAGVAEARSVEAERRRIAEAAEARVAEATEQVTMPRGAATAGTLANLRFALEQARVRAAAAAADHAESVALLEKEMAAFEEARPARRALELLKEERYRSWEQEMGRKEQQQMDEVALRIARLGDDAR